jgi:transketolase
MPNLVLIRPGDAVEVREAWKAAITRRDGPTALVLTRQNLPTLEHAETPAISKGAYVVASFGKKSPDLILIATGSELSLIHEAAPKIAEAGFGVRVVSMPSWALFEQQDSAYRESVLPRKVTARLAVEAGTRLGWERYIGSAGDMISLEHYGASAPGKVNFEKMGFTVENVVKRAKALLKAK